MQRRLVFYLALCMALALSACGASPTAPDGETPESLPEEPSMDSQPQDSESEADSPVKGLTVAFIAGGEEDPVTAAASAGAQKYGAAWGLDVAVLNGSDAAEQLYALRQAVGQGVSGICIRPVDAPALTEGLREARAARIPVVTWDIDTPPEARSLTVSQGTAAVLGSMLVEMGVTSLGERGVDFGGEVRYVWRCTGEEDTEQDAWYAAGREYIRANYPQWTELAAPYRSEREPEQAAAVGEALLDENPDADLILCCDAISLCGQCEAVQRRELNAEDITITGFCPPSLMLPYLEAGVCTRWGLWDCGLQGAMGCYLAAWLNLGNEIRVGDVVNIPRIGSVELLANDALVPGQETGAVNNGVVLLPERIVFTAANVADYDF